MHLHKYRRGGMMGKIQNCICRVLNDRRSHVRSHPSPEPYRKDAIEYVLPRLLP